MKHVHWSEKILWLLLSIFAANSYLLIRYSPWFILPAALALASAHLLPGRRLLTFERLTICSHGVDLLIVFLISSAVTAAVQSTYVLSLLPENLKAAVQPETILDTLRNRNTWDLVLTLLICIVVEASVFWHGIFCVYCTSVQMGIRYRLWGLLCGVIPVVNVIMLLHILRIVRREIRVETAKEQLNESRHDEQICKTRYPILMVHGFFFRDSRIINYWGRIPYQLEQNGAQLFYGEHQSAAAVADSAQEIAWRIENVLRKTGAEKVNIIAHSKGGLDCRYAMDQLGMTPYVASLTTINTPHRGCLFADNLLNKVSSKVQERVALIYNSLYKRLGDHQPDFLAAARDLTATGCQRFEKMPAPEGVFCQSVGSVIEKAKRGKFPLNVTYRYVKRFDGPNDGLVAESAFAWGEKYTLLTTKSKRGISHGDMMDLNRENLPDFDVREFYVQLVADLKRRGL